MWLDGVMTNAKESPQALFDTHPITFGIDWDHESTLIEPYVGKLDELVIYDRALSDDEIRQLAQ